MYSLFLCFVVVPFVVANSKKELPLSCHDEVPEPSEHLIHVSVRMDLWEGVHAIFPSVAAYGCSVEGSIVRAMHSRKWSSLAKQWTDYMSRTVVEFNYGDKEKVNAKGDAGRIVAGLLTRAKEEGKIKQSKPTFFGCGREVTRFYCALY